MSQFGLPDSNDNVLEGNKLTGISNRDRKRGCRRLNERRMDSVNISPYEQLLRKNSIIYTVTNSQDRRLLNLFGLHEPSYRYSIV